jgi:hypothetical protein
VLVLGAGAFEPQMPDVHVHMAPGGAWCLELGGRMVDDGRWGVGCGVISLVCK